MIGAGRRVDFRVVVGDMLFALFLDDLVALMNCGYLAVWFELDVLHPTLNYNQNNVHALFK
ncbi:hypothetical protein VB655_00160 [Enterobacter sp. APAP_BS8]|uniref:hypothetical protein n=1 Tax=Enterobacter sp. APAP_BS8 TaxID=3070685 RepID=UPI002FCE6B14